MDTKENKSQQSCFRVYFFNIRRFFFKHQGCGGRFPSDDVFGKKRRSRLTAASRSARFSNRRNAKRAVLKCGRSAAARLAALRWGDKSTPRRSSVMQFNANRGCVTSECVSVHRIPSEKRLLLAIEME